MEFCILGPLEVRDGGRSLPLASSRQRTLLAILLLHANEVVSSDRLIEELWDERPPETAAAALQVHVSQLRKLLEPKRARRAPGSVLVTKPPGYLLRVEEGSFDLLRFRRLAEEGQAALADGEAEQARRILREALSLWRGPALADFALETFARNEILRLEELRLAATEDLVEAELVLGRHGLLVGELEALVAAHPFRERPRAQLMLALYRGGRQADALELYRETRRTFVDELGVEPSPALHRLEQSILLQEPALELSLPARDELAPAPPIRKPVSALVAEFECATAAGDRVDPEAARPLVATAIGTAVGVLERHGGFVEELPDGSLLAVFGIPAVHEDDALRSARAASELGEALAPLAEGLRRERGLQFKLRVGISTAEVIDRGEGATLSARIGGSVVRDASRLRYFAAPGEVHLDVPTRLLVKDAVTLEPAGAAEEHWRLVSVASGASAIPRRLDAPLVGRARELAALREAFEQAVSERSCQLVTLLGPAGIGKSRLAKELASLVQGTAEVLSGHCLSYGEGITFWPLAEIVRQLVAGEVERGLDALLEKDDDGAAIAERIAAAVGPVEQPGASEATFWAVRRLFELLAARRPLVVLIDDLHWAEPTFLDLLEQVAASARDAPILILCLARPELLETRPAWPGPILPLEPLSESEADELLSGLLAEEALAETLRTRIAAVAEGNPLFLEQMVAVLGDEVEHVSIPPTIQALLAARLDLLPAQERWVLERASVVGRDFSPADLVALSAREEREAVGPLLESLSRRQLVGPVEADAFRFRHQLIRDAAYESIPKLTRAELHERCGDWLEERSSARLAEVEELLAYHLEQAFRLREEVDPLAESLPELARRAGTHLAAAGRRAHARGDMPAAVSLLRRASALFRGQDRERAELLLALASALREVGDFSAAASAVRETIELASALADPRLESEARVIDLRIRLQTQADVAIDELTRSAEVAIAELEALGDEHGLAEAWLVLAWMTWIRCQASKTEEIVRGALRYAREAGDEPATAHALNLLIGTWLFGPTPAPEAIRRCEEILGDPLTQRRIEASCCRALAALKAMQGAFDEARVLLERDREIIDDLGLRVLAAVAAEIWGMLELLALDAVAAEERLRAGTAILEPMGETSGVSTLTAMLAEAVYEQDRFDEVLTLAELSDKLAPGDDYSTQVQWRGPRAKVLARRGRFEEACAVAREAVALAARTDFLNLHGDALMGLAEVERLGGRFAEARAAASEALALYKRKGNVVSARRARKLLAELPKDRARS